METLILKEGTNQFKEFVEPGYKYLPKLTKRRYDAYSLSWNKEINTSSIITEVVSFDRYFKLRPSINDMASGLRLKENIILRIKGATDLNPVEKELLINALEPNGLNNQELMDTIPFTLIAGTKAPKGYLYFKDGRYDEGMIDYARRELSYLNDVWDSHIPYNRSNFVSTIASPPPKFLNGKICLSKKSTTDIHNFVESLNQGIINDYIVCTEDLYLNGIVYGEEVILTAMDSPLRLYYARPIIFEDGSLSEKRVIIAPIDRSRGGSLSIFIHHKARGKDGQEHPEYRDYIGTPPYMAEY